MLFHFQDANHSILNSRIAFLVATLVLSVLFVTNAQAEIKKGEKLSTQTIVDNLSYPWGMTWLNSSELLITEKEIGGWRVNVNSGSKHLIKGWPKAINTSSQGGLLDVVTDPNFEQNQTLYVSFSHRKSSGQTTTRVASARLQNDSLTDWKVLFTATPYSSKGQHFGSRLAFKGGYIYITVGDRGERDRAQDLSDNAGKIHRIKPDGSIPEDNPFVGKTANNGKPIPPSVYSYGHRNPQGVYVDKSGKVWIHEHGPRGGDELNLVQKGKNYGWPIITYGREYWGPSIGEGTHKKGMEQPYYAYVPSIAPSGLVRYEADLFTEWQGDFLIGALRKRHLNRLTTEKNSLTSPEDSQFNEYRYLEEQELRIRDVEVGADGAIYLLTDEFDGKLIRVRP